MSDGLPFAYPVNVRTLPGKGRDERYDAPEDVRTGIAEQNDLVSVESFRADAHVQPWKRDGVKVIGRVRAELVQPCAATGEPIPQSLDEDVELILVPDGSRLAKPPQNDEGELIFDAEGPDLPDTFSGDSIDLASIWMEFFVLGLDPYATAEGAVMPELENGLTKGEDSPFAALAALKKD